MLFFSFFSIDFSGIFFSRKFKGKLPNLAKKTTDITLFMTHINENVCDAREETFSREETIVFLIRFLCKFFNRNIRKA